MRQSILIAAVFCCTVVSCIEQATVTDIRSQIRQMIDDDVTDNGLGENDLRFLGGLVRLAFHDCVGDRCDGCINNNHPDNAGLEVYIDKAELLYTNLKVDEESVEMSRADFWALAGIEAVAYSSERARSETSPNVTFRSGRADCATSPTTTELHDFPSALGDTEHILNFFSTQFGFNEKEATAILGAHTLGSAHPDASGFVHPWVPRKDRLDNVFYSHLIDASKGWTQTSIGRTSSQQWFWESQGDPQQLMLNADMALIKNLSTATDNGQVSCTYSTCPAVNSDTSSWVDAFASDNDLWLEEFAKAFQKMIEKGWEGQLLEIGAKANTQSSTTASSATGTVIFTNRNLLLLLAAIVCAL